MPKRALSSLIAAAALLATATLLPGHVGSAAVGPGFPLSGVYVYSTGSQELGRESFAATEIPDGYLIHSRTRLDLETYLLDQTSELTVGPGGEFRAISIQGDSGGKPFGLTARVVGPSLVLEDTVKGVATVVDYPAPLLWITGNFMQHLLHAFWFYERGAGGSQVLASQAGSLRIDPIGSALMAAPLGEIRVELYRLTLPAGAVELAVEEDGQVPLIRVPGQEVMVRREDRMDWRLLSEPSDTAGSAP